MRCTDIFQRLTWLENIFSSPLMGPIKFLNKRFGFGGGFFNHFDGSVDLLDDLDDHYTAKTHKRERQMLVHKLQELASEFSVRITILGGDVHLAAVGRFYSSPKLDLPISRDHRYMVNIISSAIVNKPPPAAVANLLARRNKLHHLDHDTDETLMSFFNKDPGTSNITATSNHTTMPSRNWAMITENSAHGATHTNSHLTNGTDTNGTSSPYDNPGKAKDGHSWLHKGEVDAGTTHKAATIEHHGNDKDGSLDICIRVEIDQHDATGQTEPYGMTIPPLTYNGPPLRPRSKRYALSHRSADTGRPTTGTGTVRPETGNTEHAGAAQTDGTSHASTLAPPTTA
jgi:PhoD related phosphatase